MKKFVYKLAVFLLIMLSVAGVIQWLVDIRIRHKVLYGPDSLDLMKGEDNDLVFLGSSRCYAQFDPHMFGDALHLKAVNLGVDGHSELTAHRLRLLNYLAKNNAPRYAILNIDPIVVAGSADSNWNMVYKNEYARYAFWPSRENAPFVRYFKFNLVERTVPLYALLRYKVLPDCVTLNFHDTWMKEGYFRDDTHWDTTALPTIWDSMPRFYADTSVKSQQSIAAELQRINDVCLQHHIQLICVQTPVYKRIYRPRNFALPGTICSSLNIPFFDLNMPEIDDNIDYFYNADHMNTRGVAVMTRELLSRPAFRQLFTGNNVDLSGR